MPAPRPPFTGELSRPAAEQSGDPWPRGYELVKCSGKDLGARGPVLVGEQVASNGIRDYQDSPRANPAGEGALHLADGQRGSVRVRRVGVVGEQVCFSEFAFGQSMPGKEYIDRILYGSGAGEPVSDRGFDGSDGRVGADKQANIRGDRARPFQAFGKCHSIAIVELKLLSPRQLRIPGHPYDHRPGPGYSLLSQPRAGRRDIAGPAERE